MGMIYKRGDVFWIKYYVNGRAIRESSGSKKEGPAKSLLKQREGLAVTGQPVIKRVDRIRYEEIADDLRRHYETSGDRDLKEADVRFRPLARFFVGRRVVDINGALVARYVEQRQSEQVTNGTINRELATLIRMLGLAEENRKVMRRPVIHKLTEAKPRAGFFEPTQFAKVRRRLRPDLQVAVTIAYTFGWRMQSEVLSLKLSQLDLQTGTLRLEPGTTKNDEGREVRLTPELRVMLAAQRDRVLELSWRLTRVIPYLFPHLDGPHTGNQIRNFRKSWATACKRVGLLGMLRHDMRRSAVRNMVNNGIPERVAMSITGHKTRAVFDRYHIVSPGDLEAAAQKLAGTIPGTMDPGKPETIDVEFASVQ